MIEQRGLNLRGIDVDAAGDQHFFEAAGNRIKTIFVHAGQIAGVQPALGNVRPAQAQLTHAICHTGLRHGCETSVGKQHRPADGAGLQRGFFHAHRKAIDARLGEPIALLHHQAPSAIESRQRCGQRRASADAPAQVAHVRGVPLRHAREHFEDGGHGEEIRTALALQMMPHFARIEAVVQYDVAAQQEDRWKRNAEAARVIERRAGASGKIMLRSGSGFDHVRFQLCHRNAAAAWLYPTPEPTRTTRLPGLILPSLRAWSSAIATHADPV